MKKIILKVISLTLVLIMVTGIAPMGEIAGLNIDLSKLNIFSIKASATTSGSCGTSVTWNYDGISKILTISGKGAIGDISSNAAPWQAYKNDIESIVVEDGVTRIAPNAFYDCTAVKTISLPESLLYIGNYAFQNCSSLNYIFIPQNVHTVATRALFACNSLTKIDVAEANSYFCSVEGVLFNKDKSILYVFPAGIVEDYYLVPETTREIYRDAFSYTKVTTIYFSNATKALGNNVFEGSTSLNEIIVTRCTDNIGTNILKNCSAKIISEPGAPIAKYCKSNGYNWQSVHEKYKKKSSTQAVLGDDNENRYYNYGLFNDELTWIQAKYVCEALGGHLATVKSSNENSQIKSLLNSSNKSYFNFDKDAYWIGFVVDEDSNNWEWVTGQPVTYGNEVNKDPWYSGDPNYTNNGTDEKCVAIAQTDYLWRDYKNERSNMGFVCEYTCDITPVDYMFYNGHCYFVFNNAAIDDSSNKNSYSQVKKVCETMGGHLVTITSEEENNALASLINGQLQGCYWIGLSKSDGNWKWVTDEEFKYGKTEKQSPWDSNEPSGNGENFVAIISKDFATAYGANSTKQLGEWADLSNDYLNDSGSQNLYTWGNTGFIMEIDNLDYEPVKSGYYGNNYYEVYENSVGYSVANQFAINKGGHLVTITSSEEESFIDSFVKTKTTDKIGYWLGAEKNDPAKVATADGYIWNNGDTFTYTNWASGKPGAQYMNGNNVIKYSDGWHDNPGTRYIDNYTTYFIVEYDNKTETVVFSEADGSIIKSESILGNTVIESSVYPAKEGYTAEWYRDNALERIWDKENVIIKPTVLYVNWVPNKYKLTFDSDGGDLSITKKTVTFDSKYGTLPKPSKAGYSFVGWYDAKTNGNNITASSIVRNSKDHSLYAMYTPNTYTVTFDAKGGVLIGENGKNVTFNSSYGELPTAKKDGYCFRGWKLDLSKDVFVNSNSDVNTPCDHTLYAYWDIAERCDSGWYEVIPNRTEYVLGEQFDPFGIEYFNMYEDGRREIIRFGFEFENGEPPIFTTTGAQTVRVFYDGSYIDVEVNVTKGEPTSISIKSVPSKTQYSKGEALVTSGIVLELTYLDGSKDTTTTGFTCQPSILSRVGEQKITVNYGDLSTSYYVNVSSNTKAIKEIGISTLPTKTEYIIGEHFDQTGLILTAKYDDGTEETLTGPFIVSVFKTNSGTEEYSSICSTKITKAIIRLDSSDSNIFDVELPITVKEAVQYGGKLAISNKIIAYQGKYVDIPVSITDNQGVMGFQINFKYNANVFTPDSVIAGSVLNGNLITNIDSISNNESSEEIIETIKIIYSGTENITNNGVLFTVRLFVNEDALELPYAISVDCPSDFTYNENYEKIGLEGLSSTITVKHVCVGSLQGTVEPTCAELGYTGDEICNICNDVIAFGKAIPPMGHKLTDMNNNGDGTRSSKCTVCGEEFIYTDVTYMNVSNSISVKGEYVTWTIKTSASVNYLKLTGSYTIDGTKKSITVMYRDTSTSSNVSVVDKGDDRTWIIKQKMSYTGEADSVIENFVLYYKVEDNTTFLTFNSPNPIAVTIYASASMLPQETVQYDPYTLVNVSGPESIKVGERDNVKIVTTDDCTKVRIGYMTDSGAMKYTTFQTTSLGYVAFTDANGLRTWTISFKFTTDVKEYTVNSRGAAWGEAKTFVVNV